MKLISNAMDVRIKRIVIENFRSIHKACVVFPNSDENSIIEERPSVLGLYGQNGSGKTSIVLALNVVKRILSGEGLVNEDKKLIRFGADKCSIDVTFLMSFSMVGSEGEIPKSETTAFVEANYAFDIACAAGEQSGKEQMVVKNEILKFRMSAPCKGIIIPKQIWFDTRASQSDDKGVAFGSKQKFSILMGFDQSNMDKAKELKEKAQNEGKSFLFYREFQNLLGDVFKVVMEDSETMRIGEMLASSDSLDVLPKEDELSEEQLMAVAFERQFSMPYYVLKVLRLFALECFHVVGTSTTGLVYGGTIPLVMIRKNRVDDNYVPYRINLQRDAINCIPKNVFPRVRETIQNISIVLTKVVPGLTIEVEEMQPNENVCFVPYPNSIAIELFSCRDGIKMPLSMESDGIKKIVSIMILLIAAYNDSSVTVIIDEIDAGIFEYLLGEILKVLSESAKGQIVFTAHNLRPLEVLPAKDILFTTPNPENPIVKIPNRGNSNLRDTYFRYIILGRQESQVYIPTDRDDIDLAFYCAGHPEE